MPSLHVLDRLDGYLDREFDLATSLEIEQHLEACPQCHADYESRKALIARVIADGAYHRAPDALRQRVRAAVEPEERAGGALGMQRWLVLAASIVLAAGLSSGATYWMNRGTAHAGLEEQVVASHVRSLLVENRLTDVASSDEHTVKPWFNHRLDFAPPVEDWTAQGYPLVGGRLDYLANRTVAALVYRHRQHLVNVFIWPDAAAKITPVEQSTRQGYTLVHWSDGSMTFWAASDLNGSELLGFCEQLRAKAAKAS